MPPMNDEQPAGVRPAQREHALPVTADVHITGETPVERAYSAITGANEAFGEFVADMHGLADQFSDAGLKNQIAAFANTQAAKAVDEAEASVNDRYTQAAEKVAQVRKELVQPGDMAQELRNDRTWRRTKQLLDSAADGNVAATAQKIIAGADRSQIGAIVEELPAYLRLKNQDPAWIESALDQAVPELAAAKQELLQAEKAKQYINHGATAVRNGIKAGRPAITLPSPAEFDPDK